MTELSAARGQEEPVPAERGRPGPDASRRGAGMGGGLGMSWALEQRLGDGRRVLCEEQS